jgi:hypothetical protein
MGLGHDGDDGDARGGAHGLGAQLWQERVAVLVRHRAVALEVEFERQTLKPGFSLDRL